MYIQHNFYIECCLRMLLGIMLYWYLLQKHKNLRLVLLLLHACLVRIKLSISKWWKEW